MFLRFHEPKSEEYVYIDEHGDVHLIMPVMSGTRIGTNHLDHLVDSLRWFLNIRNRDQKPRAASILWDYRNKLAIDLKYLPDDSPVKASKLKRLAQIDIYRNLISIVQRDEAFRYSLGQNLRPTFPGVLTTLMDDSNLRIILLRPWKTYPYIPIPVQTPCFSLRHNRYHKEGVCSSVLNELHPIYATYFSSKSLEQRMEIESPQSLFDSAKDGAELISLTEFFLAILNIFCRDQNLSEANFGAILDSNKQLTRHLAEVVINALKENQSVEEALLKAICEKKRFFGISNWLDDSSLAKFKRDFITLYNQIHGSPQFDQFMLLSETKKGDFFVHHGSISMLFTRLLQTDDFAERLDDEQKAFITTAEENFDGVARDGNILPDTHAHIHAAIQGIDLVISQFSHAALRDLYEEICCYTDPAVKQEALRQLQAERPDFHPELDFAAFLKHVAYGQQKQAEQMLQKYQNFTQKLLRLDTIPFTDRAGRTFTCTAYEYAMRVKDGHMLRMLERYIVQDIETTRIIYERAQDVLYPELRYNSTFFGRLKNDAWHYTTCDNGVVRDHYEQFVGIAPLVRALKQLTNKVREMNTRSAAYSPGERAELTHIWVEEVGGAQRMLPEHMIQEYSQSGSERAFEQLLKNPQLLDSAHPKNLKRRLRDDEKTLWFSEALGSVYAIARGRINFPYSIDSAPDILGMAWGTSSEQESEVIRLIDTIRTKDVYDSFNRLAELLPTNHETACMRLY